MSCLWFRQDFDFKWHFILSPCEIETERPHTRWSFVYVRIDIMHSIISNHTLTQYTISPILPSFNVLIVCISIPPQKYEDFANVFAPAKRRGKNFSKNPIFLRRVSFKAISLQRGWNTVPQRIWESKKISEIQHCVIMGVANAVKTQILQVLMRWDNLRVRRRVWKWNLVVGNIKVIWWWHLRLLCRV